MKSHWKRIPDVTIGKNEPLSDQFFALSEKGRDLYGLEPEVAEDRPVAEHSARVEYIHHIRWKIVDVKWNEKYHGQLL